MRICPQCGTRFTEPTQFCPHDGSQTYEAMENQGTRQDPLLGRVIDGRYRVEQQIGEGGMGVVYQATHTVLHKKLALKVLRGDNSKDAEVVHRFMQEAQAATSIGHSNIVDISDFGRLPDGAVYFVMEYLNGTSLSEMIKRGGSVPTQEAIHIVRQIASALEAVHARGIVHRDLKPDNIFVIKQGGDARFVKVLDFGVAKVGGAASRLTKTGMVFGTPHYMSPEQAAGHSVDQRTDVYALGVIMYEMFTGKVPFDADTFMGILSKHMFEAPARPSDVKGQSLGALEAVILRALEKNPDHRYQGMDQVLADLDTVAAGGTVNVGGRPGVAPPGNLAEALELPRTDSTGGHRTQAGAQSGMKNVILIAAALGALVMVSVVTITAVFLLTGDDEEEAQAQTTHEEATEEEPPTAPAAQPPAVLTAPRPTAPRVVTPPPQAMVSIRTDPAGAEVLLDGVMVGNTPVDVPRPDTGSQQITLRLRDYEEMNFQINPQTTSSLTLTLAPQRQAVVREPRRSVAPMTARATPPVILAHPPSIAAPPPPRRTSTSEVVDPWAN